MAYYCFTPNGYKHNAFVCGETISKLFSSNDMMLVEVGEQYPGISSPNLESIKEDVNI